MKRLKPGEYIAMTDEQKKAHRKALHNQWLKKPGNRQRNKERNKIYQARHSEKVKNTPYEKRCARCGRIAIIYGRGVICDECRAKPSLYAILEQERKERRKAREARRQEIVNLAMTTNMTQQEIADALGTYQERVSVILRDYGLRRNPYQKRSKK